MTIVLDDFKTFLALVPLVLALMSFLYVRLPAKLHLYLEFFFRVFDPQSRCAYRVFKMAQTVRQNPRLHAQCDIDAQAFSQKWDDGLYGRLELEDHSAAILYRRIRNGDMQSDSWFWNTMVHECSLVLEAEAASRNRSQISTSSSRTVSDIVPAGTSESFSQNAHPLPDSATSSAGNAVCSSASNATYASSSVEITVPEVALHSIDPDGTCCLEPRPAPIDTGLPTVALHTHSICSTTYTGSQSIIISTLQTEHAELEFADRAPSSSSPVVEMDAVNNLS
ncbi:hypothetical protein D9758_007050 [Tetrapyrgos nigripes]|uniref:Uncharacterized protein n=1 Tax=Tetrapyrgos nigripes TaxID=182062 RepID=A0A8H5LMW8_9AGAR|nr:hypothetical protein D9758_007050 [Tetrapyrgos nigripes]